MKIGIIWKIIGGIVLAGSSVAAITLATIKLNSKNNNQSDVGQQTNDEVASSGKADKLSEDNSQDSVDVQDNSEQKKQTDLNESTSKNDISFFVEDTENDLISGDYQCQFENQNKFDCTISYVEITEKELNHSFANEFSKQKDNSDISDTAKKDLIYKVTSKIKGNESKIIIDSESFDVFTKETSESKYTLDILFAVDGNGIHENTKTEYFIFKSDQNKLINSGEGETFKCWINGEKSTSDDGEEGKDNCYIFDFGKSKSKNQKNDLIDWIFEKKDNHTKSIEDQKYYLIQFDDVIENALQIKNITIKKEDNDSGHNYYVTAVSLYEYGTTKDKSHLFILE